MIFESHNLMLKYGYVNVLQRASFFLSRWGLVRLAGFDPLVWLPAYHVKRLQKGEGMQCRLSDTLDKPFTALDPGIQSLALECYAKCLVSRWSITRV